ncbi:hypothetical protein MUS_0103 [Bacillus velezensis YAU B9601-Y2]|uniref:Uncharacterized protein n=1 Tax=Bacillus amyloliquefaciens (strain Y2) TaxID=1155777 RepID=I2C0L7_BACAY|nr:hypothetical protein MUS_0103 [Bacillus velezensis YAU B9601-Y2]
MEPRGKSVSVMFTCRGAFFIGGKQTGAGREWGEACVF